jgi:hypothetical protein
LASRRVPDDPVVDERVRAPISLPEGTSLCHDDDIVTIRSPRHSITFTLVLVLVAVGCSSESERVAGPLEAAGEKLADLTCPCLVAEDATTTLEQCKEGMSADPSYEACVTGLAESSPAIQGFLDCQIESLESIYGCVEGMTCEEYFPEEEYFVCDDGTQIPLSFRCDDFYDCDDFSDEAGCTSFVCGDGSSIGTGKICDGTVHCADGSDEAGCPTTFAECHLDNLPYCPELSEEEWLAIFECN